MNEHARRLGKNHDKISGINDLHIEPASQKGLETSITTNLTISDYYNS